MNVTSRVNEISPYNVGERFNLPDDWLYCDWNESLFPPTPKVQEHILSFIENSKLQNYPDISNKELLNHLSNYTGLPTEYIEVYNGSDDALKDIFCTFVDETKSVLTYQPTYSQVDTFIETNTKLYTKVPIINPLGNHEYNFSDTLDNKYDVVYLVNPNNPTGKLIPVEILESIIEEYSSTLFIVDEAYFEYSNITCSNLVRWYDNVLITRTFSKAFGLASLRLGYVLGSPDTLNGMRKIKNGKSVNALAQVAGIACLEDLDYLNSCVKETLSSTKFFTEEVNKIEGYHALESKTNFVLIKVPDVEEFKNLMESNNILIRDRSYLENLDNCVRINFGSKELTKRILDIVKGQN